MSVAPPLGHMNGTAHLHAMREGSHDNSCLFTTSNVDIWCRGEYSKKP